MIGKELETWMLFRKTYAKAQRYVEDDLRRFSTTPSQFSILRNLSMEEATPMSELSRKISCVNSNITSIVGRMEEKGLVERVQDKEDRRVVKVNLTEKGKNLYRETVPTHYQYLKKMMDCFNEEDFEELNKLLYKLYSNVK